MQHKKKRGDEDSDSEAIHTHVNCADQSLFMGLITSRFPTCTVPLTNYDSRRSARTILREYIVRYRIELHLNWL